MMRKTLIGAMASLFLLLGTGLVAGSADAQDTTPEPTVDPAATPVPTTDPAATPVPTTDPAATPVPTTDPAATAVPTATPEPTVDPAATPVPTADPAGPTPEPTATAAADTTGTDNDDPQLAFTGPDTRVMIVGATLLLTGSVFVATSRRQTRRFDSKLGEGWSSYR